MSRKYNFPRLNHFANRTLNILDHIRAIGNKGIADFVDADGNHWLLGSDMRFYTTRLIGRRNRIVVAYKKETMKLMRHLFEGDFSARIFAELKEKDVA